MEEFETTSEVKTTHAKPFWKSKLVFFQEHQTASIVGLFLLLPILVVGIFAGFIQMRNSSDSNSAEVTATPTPLVTKAADSVSPTPMAVSTIASGKPTTKPTATLKVTSKPTTGTPAPTTSATATPQQKLSNVYFHSVVCNYVDPTASGSASIKRLDDVTFANAAAVPSTATCDVIFQNAEDTETGDIKYTVYSDNDQQKSTTVGKLKKGNYPTSEYKGYQEIVNLKSSTGSHEVKFELNPETRTFQETSYSDNYKAIKYKVQ
jgi:hypothetical protein